MFPLYNYGYILNNNTFKLIFLAHLTSFFQAVKVQEQDKSLKFKKVNNTHKSTLDVV